jgi:hypothetical protein
MAGDGTCAAIGPRPPRVRGAVAYRPRRPAETVLYRVVARHVQTFLARADHDPARASLPFFVRAGCLSVLRRAAHG